MAGIGIIANPNSKLNRRNPDRPKLLSYIVGERGQFELTASLADLSKVASDFLAKDISILALNGGDGTISQTISAFLRVYGEKPLPKIAILRGGTMNMLADNLKLHGSPQELLSQLIEAYSTGAMKTIAIPTIRIGDQHGFLFASGTSARFLAEFYKNKTGFLGAIWLILRLMASLVTQSDFAKSIVHMDHIRMRPDDAAPIEHASQSVLCATVDCMPMNVPYFKPSPDPNKGIRYASVTYTNRALGIALPWLMLRRGQDRIGQILGVCRKMSIRHNHDLIYTLDGELFTSRTGEIVLEQGPVMEFVKPVTHWKHR